jgi:hypothetical protein
MPAPAALSLDTHPPQVVATVLQLQSLASQHLEAGKRSKSMDVVLQVRGRGGLMLLGQGCMRGWAGGGQAGVWWCAAAPAALDPPLSLSPPPLTPTTPPTAQVNSTATEEVLWHATLSHEAEAAAVAVAAHAAGTTGKRDLADLPAALQLHMLNPDMLMSGMVTQAAIEPRLNQVFCE